MMEDVKGEKENTGGRPQLAESLIAYGTCLGGQVAGA
jgi:hypothetical protein